MCTHMQGHSYTKKPAPNVGCLPQSLYTCCFETGFCGTQSPWFQLDWLAHKLELPGCTCLVLPRLYYRHVSGFDEELWIWIQFSVSQQMLLLEESSLAPVLLFFNPPQSPCLIVLFCFFLPLFLLLSTQLGSS